jgi:NTP pyrophosphatase (non-canonical NTP hydrolase)
MYDGTFTTYQAQARKTAIYPSDMAVIYPALEICGESGEIAELVKKAIRDDGGAFSPERDARLRKEIGDVLWGLANLATDKGWKLSEIAGENLDKLAHRQERDALGGSGDDR